MRFSRFYLPVFAILAFLAATFLGLLFAYADEGDRVIVPVMKGAAAPKSGLLVPETKYKEFLDAEIEVDKLRWRLEFATKKYEEALGLQRGELLYARNLIHDPPWYKRPTFLLTVGFVGGIVVSALTVWAGVEILQSLP